MEADAPFTQIVSVAVGTFGFIVVTWSEIVTTVNAATPNFQVQRADPTWHNCISAFADHTNESVIGFAGGFDDATAFRILGPQTVVVPDTNPIEFPREVTVPFP